MEIQNENEQNLDNKVQELLNDLTVPYNPDHWQIMSQRLLALDAADSSFDNLVRQQLENTTPSFQATHWDLMNKKLDDLGEADADFDASIREQLNNLHRSYQPKHWELMSQRIEQEFSWKAKIMRYKVVEVALMFLLLFTVFNYFETVGYEKEGNFKTSEPNTIEKKVEPKTFNRGIDWRNRDNINRGNKEGTKQQDNFITQPQNTKPPIVSVEPLNNSVGKDIVSTIGTTVSREQNAENRILIGTENSANPLSKESFKQMSDFSRTEVGNIIQIPTLQASEIALVEKDFKGNLPKNTEGVVSAQSIAVLRPNALTIAQLYDAPVLPQVAKKDKWWRLGVFGSGSLSNVSSSYVYKDDTKKWNFWSLNKSIGLVAGFRKKKVEIETGLSYNTIRYQPDLPESILAGKIITGLSFQPELTKEVELGVVKLPLNLNIHFEDKNRWHIYAMTGVAVNAAFKIDTTNFALAAPTLLTAYSRSKDYMDFPVYEEPFKLGPEKNSHNFYFTANLGVGLEYKISSRYSAYIQPQYERQFGKAAIGTRGDRINALTVQGGLKMQLGNIKY